MKNLFNTIGEGKIMFTSVYSKKDLQDISARISKNTPMDAGGGVSTNYELQEDIASLSTKVLIQDRLISNLLLRVVQLENSLPLIGM